jgi:hypothetical protein
MKFLSSWFARVHLLDKKSPDTETLATCIVNSLMMEIVASMCDLAATNEAAIKVIKRRHPLQHRLFRAKCQSHTLARRRSFD